MPQLANGFQTALFSLPASPFLNLTPSTANRERWRRGYCGKVWGEIKGEARRGEEKWMACGGKRESGIYAEMKCEDLEVDTQREKEGEIGGGRVQEATRNMNQSWLHLLAIF